MKNILFYILPALAFVSTTYANNQPQFDHETDGSRSMEENSANKIYQYLVDVKNRANTRNRLDAKIVNHIVQEIKNLLPEYDYTDLGSFMKAQLLHDIAHQVLKGNQALNDSNSIDEAFNDDFKEHLKVALDSHDAALKNNREDIAALRKNIAERNVR